MAAIQTFYFSRIVGKPVVTKSNQPVGKIKDLIVDLEGIRPRVVAIQLKTPKATRTVDFLTCKITKEKGQYRFILSEVTDIDLDNTRTMSIGRHVQDRQLVDMDGRKLVRVNDVRLAVISKGTYLVAVDVGLHGLFRRLGIAKPIMGVLKRFKKTLPSNLILWEDVETVDFGHAGIKLAKDHSNLHKLHPSDLADIIEDLDKNTRIAVFASLDEEQAADVLEELEPGMQKIMLENMALEKAADLLEKMPADEVADILDELNKEQAEALLGEMESEASDEVRELMEYPENSVGSVMTTDYIFFNQNETVDGTIATLRRLKPESDTIYYIYIVNENEKLIATVSLRDIIVSAPETLLSEIMDKDVLYVYDHDKIDVLNEVISKYSLLAVPVVDEDRIMVGVVIVNDVVYNLLRARRKRM